MSLCWKQMGFVLLAFPLIVIGGHQTEVSTSKPSSSPISLAAWRKLDAKGQACASCHSPDGLELAVYGFSDADILRRARNHLPPAEADQIVEQIHQLRDAYHISTPLDPMKDRPLQPGGEMLDGATPMDRDKRFAELLANQLQSLFGGPIRSIEMAEQARDEVLEINLSQLKIGIPFLVKTRAFKGIHSLPTLAMPHCVQCTHCHIRACSCS